MKVPCSASVVAALSLLGVTELARGPSLAWKAASTALLPALVTPWIARLAVSDAPAAGAPRYAK